MGNPAQAENFSDVREKPGQVDDQSGMPETGYPTGDETSHPRAENYPPAAQAYPPQQQPYPSPAHNYPPAGYVPTQPAYPQQRPSYPPAVQGQPIYPKPAPVTPHYAPNPANRIGTQAWTTGLFDCMEDPNNALITFLAPCFTFGQIAEIIDEGHSTCTTSGIMYAAIGVLTAFPSLISCGYRSKLRNKYDLVEAPAADWMTHVFCELCALCQEYRELKNRGYDPEIGWHGNQLRLQAMQHQQQQVQMAPPMNQNMNG